MSQTKLKEIVFSHLKNGTYQTPTDQEVTDCVDSLMSFFEILIEEDKKLMKVTHDPSNYRNPDNPD